MPNWCRNSLYIRGPKAEIQRFLDALETKDTIAPFPDEFRSGKAVEQARKWCQRNWGTKWRIHDKDLTIVEIVEWGDNNELEVKLEFDTAWIPPIPLILEASRRFKELEFDLRFCDPPNAFGGIYRAKDGFDVHVNCGSLVRWEFNMLSWSGVMG
jgi:hypothetical protein